MSSEGHFEVERRGRGYRASLDGSRRHVNVAGHFVDQLAERWDCDVAVVLSSLLDGRIITWNQHGYYAAELTGGLLGSQHMLVILGVPDRYDADAISLVTVYPSDWDGTFEAEHVHILFRHGHTLVPRRPVRDLFEGPRAA